jgi:phosphohistidine phosphatase
VRHGDADAEIPEGLGDEARALTAKARQATMAHFNALVERIGAVDLVLTSPLVRAVQTAQLLSIAHRYEGPLRAHRSLLPDMPVGSLDKVLTDHAGEHLILVGHQPSMGAMAAHLLGLQSFPKQVNPGTVIGLERPDGEGGGPAQLLFYAPPGQSILEAL